ncbi:MAG: hypothetical protein DWI24_05695 [Planctomycetota bacterium]|nr:MAG: hypothetical protein DWI24_05695 [Planctomycetota bacterium]
MGNLIGRVDPGAGWRLELKKRLPGNKKGWHSDQSDDIIADFNQSGEELEPDDAEGRCGLRVA